MIKQKDIEDLALLLLYCSSWDDNPKKEYIKEPVIKAWKNIRFDIIDSLSEKGLIDSRKGRKSITFTDEGIKKAEETKVRLFK